VICDVNAFLSQQPDMGVVVVVSLVTFAMVGGLGLAVAEEAYNRLRKHLAARKESKK